jgi:hypothetical protein
MSKQEDIAANLSMVRARVARAADMAGRPSDSVRLLAVSKRQPPQAIRAALAAGQREFGESYLQEAQAKMSALGDASIEWHFIGPLQSNKTRGVAQSFAWVHSVDRLNIAQRLNRQRSVELPPLNICVQVNVSAESSKSGVPVEALHALLGELVDLPRLRLRGLMAIPRAERDPLRQREPFRRMRDVYEAMKARGYPLDTLSMGMSSDLEAAIAEGATIVRVGSAIFGARA